MISSRFCDRFLGWLDWVQPHHTLHGSSATGRITLADPRAGFVGDPDAGLYVHPTIVDGVTMDDDLYKQETFGPIVGVASFADFDEAIALANGTRYGLQAGIFTADVRAALRAAQELEFGGVTVNEAPTFRADQMPYGGVKDSGNTREGPAYAVRELTEQRVVVIDL